MEDEVNDYSVTPLSDTPSNSPRNKKGKPTVAEDSNSIVARLSLLINNQADSLEKMVSANTLKIEGLKKTIDFVSGEMKDIKASKDKDI